MVTRHAQLMDIRPIFDIQHGIGRARVEVVIAAVTKGEDAYGDPIIQWDMPPVLVLEDAGNGHTILDGHHRGTAAKKLGIETIPAWVLSIADYVAIIEADFDGSMPNRLSDLREHIICGNVDGDSICSHGA